MSGMKADGVLYLAAEFIDTFKEINKQVNKGAVEVAKNNQIKLSVDEKSISESIEGMLKSKRLEGFDLSDMIIPALQKASNQNLSKEDRVRTLKELEDNLLTLRRAPLKVLKGLKGANSKDITTAVQNINQDMLDNPTKWATVSPSKEIGRMLSEQLSSTVNDIQNQLVEEFGERIAKYGVDAKTAKAKMEAIYEKAFNEEGELDAFELYDDEFSNTSQKMKDFRAYYQRLGKLGEKIPEKFEELFEVISDHLDTLDEDEDTEKAVKDWIESIFTLEDKVIDYANKEASLNKQAADKLDAQKKQAKQDKSSGRDRINPIYDNIYDNEAEESKSSILDKKTKKEDKIQETRTQQQENKKIVEQINEITATESKTVDVKKKQTQEIEKQNDLLKEQKQIEDEEDETYSRIQAEIEAETLKGFEKKRDKINDVIYSQYLGGDYKEHVKDLDKKQ